MTIKEALKGTYYIDADNIAVASDGGTIAFELIDSVGRPHLLFIDGRANSRTKNHLYACMHTIILEKKIQFM